MTSPDMLRKIAAAPAGLRADQFRGPDLRAAHQAGLVEFSSHGPVRFVRLSDKGRKEQGLAPRHLGFIERLKDRLTWR